MTPRSDAALAAAFVLIWSSGFIGSQLGTEVAPTTTLLAWRFPIAALVLVLWRLRRRTPFPRPGAIGLQAMIGVLAQGGFLLGVVLAVQLGVPAGTTALVASLQPVVAGVLAGPVLGERVRPLQWLGLIAGLVGVTLVVGSDLTAATPAPAWAYGLPFGAMASLVAATLIERRARPTIGMVDGLAIQCATSAVLFGALAAATGTLAPPAGTHFWFAVAWMIVLSTFGGYGCYWAALRRGGVTRVSSLLYLTPATTSVWAYLMFGAHIDGWALVGMAVSLASVLLVFRPRRPTRLVRASGRYSPLTHGQVGGELHGVGDGS